MYEYEYDILTCPECGATVTVKATIERGFSDHEEINCPLCKTFITEIRADMGYEIIKVLNKNGIEVKGY